MKYYSSAYLKGYIDSHINIPSLQQSSHQSQDGVGKEKRDCIPNTTPISHHPAVQGRKAKVNKASYHMCFLPVLLASSNFLTPLRKTLTAML